jgi:AcrR family transcriptional regulator
MSETAPPSSVDSPARRRLLEGMARAVADKGYADTTITDIVREAAVSRRTFYEHFTTKSDCLIALYDAASHQALRVLADAIDPELSWQGQLEGAMRAYLGCLASSPVLLRTLFIDILALGGPGLAIRRAMSQEIADFILQVAARPSSTPASAPFTKALAMAVVGGIHELVLEAIEQERPDSLEALVVPASELVRAVALRQG